MLTSLERLEWRPVVYVPLIEFLRELDTFVNRITYHESASELMAIDFYSGSGIDT